MPKIALLKKKDGPGKPIENSIKKPMKSKMKERGKSASFGFVIGSERK